MSLIKISGNLIQANTISADKIASTVELGGPKIANVQIANSSWSVLDDTAVSTDGGYILINGSGFVTGCSVIVGTTDADSVAFVNSSVLRATVPAANASTYTVYVVNPDGGTATRVKGLTYSALPSWVTGSTLSSTITDTEYSYQLEATGATSYTLQAGSTLPANATLNANGLLIGTTTVESNTNYSFTVVATDDENQDSPRTFSLNISAVLSIPANYLIVAGGGASGADVGGAGGAGGLLQGNTDLIGGTTYNITVGAGGTACTSSPATNIHTNGSNSVCFGLTAQGGGKGAYWLSSPGGNGGSGGGGSGGTQAAGTGVNGQGYSGGSGNGAGYLTGGGGGAGGAGSNASTSNGGNGGPGLYSSISGSNTAYAGGGGGGCDSGGSPGTGGVGGGGNGEVRNTGSSTAGATNTGGGGGGNGGYQGGRAGGSGVVIIRYPDTYANAISTTGSPTFTQTGGYRIYKFTGSGSISF